MKHRGMQSKRRSTCIARFPPAPEAGTTPPPGRDRRPACGGASWKAIKQICRPPPPGRHAAGAAEALRAAGRCHPSPHAYPPPERAFWQDGQIGDVSNRSAAPFPCVGVEHGAPFWSGGSDTAAAAAKRRVGNGADGTRYGIAPCEKLAQPGPTAAARPCRRNGMVRRLLPVIERPAAAAGPRLRGSAMTATRPTRNAS